MMVDLLGGFKPFYKNLLEKFMSETCLKKKKSPDRQFE